jgi:hypothetical protein
MSLTLAIALAFIIVSVVMAAVYNGWTNPLVWIGWAFAVMFILAPLIGR